MTYLMALTPAVSLGELSSLAPLYLIGRIWRSPNRQYRGLGITRLLERCMLHRQLVQCYGLPPRIALGRKGKWALRAGVWACGSYEDASECFLRPPYSPTSIGMRPTDVTSLFADDRLNDLVYGKIINLCREICVFIIEDGAVGWSCKCSSGRHFRSRTDV